MSENKAHRAGFAAIVGAPNAGKSTLLNMMLGQKVAIVAARPQTTRRRILGVLSADESQIIFWDTPGLHTPGQALLNREMVSQALAALEDSDLALWVVDALRRGAEHETALEAVLQSRRPILAALNKVDALGDKSLLLPLIREIEEAAHPAAIVPVSARTGEGLPELAAEIVRLLPENPPFYPEDALTDQPERLIAAEMVREAVFRFTSQEIPYATAVTVDEFNAAPALVRIAATIHVEKESQKGVIIGRGGAMLKRIGQSARLDIERLVGGKVFLKLFVRTTRDWSKKRSTLLEFGYGD